MLTYVDDLLIICEKAEIVELVKQQLKSIFSIVDLGEIQAFWVVKFTEMMSLGNLK